MLWRSYIAYTMFLGLFYGWLDQNSNVTREDSFQIIHIQGFNEQYKEAEKNKKEKRNQGASSKQNMYALTKIYRRTQLSW